MNVYYWEDLGSIGYDCVAYAGSKLEARKIAKEKLKGECDAEDYDEICAALDGEPTGIFHYDTALWIFTEIDTAQARLSRNEWATLSQQMRQRASFAGTTASLKRLLLTWAEVIEGKPSTGWASMNRQDLDNEKES